jgi:hypothetical protein
MDNFAIEFRLFCATYKVELLKSDYPDEEDAGMSVDEIIAKVERGESKEDSGRMYVGRRNCRQSGEGGK